jgi:cytochrome c oxidase subunit II
MDDEVDAMKKILFGILVMALVLLFTACSGRQQTTSQGTPQDSTTGATNSGTGTGTVREFTMTVKNFEFSPAAISVNKGDTVKIIIKSSEGNHGIAIPDFGISQELPLGEEHTIEFVADKTGQFNFFCNVPCGPGHKNMKGTITVT